MQNAPDQLSYDIDALEALVAEYEVCANRHKAEKEAIGQYRVCLDFRVLSLQEQLNRALARRYVASNEKLAVPRLSITDFLRFPALAGFANLLCDSMCGAVNRGRTARDEVALEVRSDAMSRLGAMRANRNVRNQ